MEIKVTLYNLKEFYPTGLGKRQKIPVFPLYDTKFMYKS